MDVYSAARRLRSPIHFEAGRVGQEIPIEQRGIIGDGSTSALVRADGIIDWLCMPRFDSPSVFGAIVDPDRGGSMGVMPTQPFRSTQRYDPDTNVLETLFEVGGEGVVRLTDFMPWSDDPRSSIHEVHRRIECLEGSVELRVVYDPRFDYGRAAPTFEKQEHGILAKSGESSLALILDCAPTWQERGGGGLETTLQLGAGQRRWVVLSWDAVQCESLAAYRPYEHLRATRARWREWSHRLGYSGPWRHHVLRSALLLKLLIYRPTGAMVAAPTTSLPEWVGGTRNWDYRFTWSRDASMAVRATNLLGYDQEALEFFHFMRDALSRSQAGLGVMYTIDGHEVPVEQELDHLRGYGGSAPVRIGNGARHQLQLDAAGAVVDAAFLYERFGGTLTIRTWRELRRVIEDVVKQWREPDHGIWEPRTGKQHNVHSKLMCWLALDRGAYVAELFGEHEAKARWTREAQAAKAWILENGLDSSGKHFVRHQGSTEADAALLALPINGLLPPNDPRITATVDFVRERLSAGPFIYRYRNDDGVGGEEGAFVLCGFWLAEALALCGRIEEAEEVFVEHAEQASNHLGLLGEEVDPTNRSALGNFPQAFSHLGLINAAARIDLAMRMRDGGHKAVPSLLPPAGL